MSCLVFLKLFQNHSFRWDKTCIRIGSLKKKQKKVIAIIATPSFFQAKQAILEMDAIRKFCFLHSLKSHCLLVSLKFLQVYGKCQLWESSSSLFTVLTNRASRQYTLFLTHWLVSTLISQFICELPDGLPLVSASTHNVRYASRVTLAPPLPPPKMKVPQCISHLTPLAENLRWLSAIITLTR